MKSTKKPKKLFDSSKLSLGLAENLRSDLSHYSHAACSDYISDRFLVEKQGSDFLKKFLPPSFDDSELETVAFIKFLDVCNRIESVNNRFDDILDIPDVNRVLGRARTLCKQILGDIWEDELFLRCRHSNGSSIGVPYTDTSLEAKWKYPLTYSGNINKWFEYYLTWDSGLKKSLALNGPVVFKHVVGSRATTVPKDSTKKRMICIEPTLNMFFQQGLMSVMSSRLNNWGLSFSVLQDVHRSLAQIASIDRRKATIDWSSASDCVSMSLVRFLLPRTWLHYVETFRSPTITVDGSTFEPPMVSTMGNATTFPLETLVFYCIAVACLTPTTGRSSLVDPGCIHDDNGHLTVSVFGDDCIVPEGSVDRYLSIMSVLGFEPNIEKTFRGNSCFRESCGGDYLRGFDVRPYYLRSPLNENLSSLEPWLYICLNRLINRYLRIWGPLKYLYDKAIFRYVFSLFRLYNLSLKIVPTHFPDDAGAKLGYDLSRWLNSYPEIEPLLSPVISDKNGIRKFRYLRFQYPSKTEVQDHLRYATDLKAGLVSVDHSFYSNLRRRGGYVAAQANSYWFSIC